MHSKMGATHSAKSLIDTFARNANSTSVRQSIVDSLVCLQGVFKLLHQEEHQLADLAMEDIQVRFRTVGQRLLAFL